MEIAFDVITTVAVAGSIALLLWGGTVSLGELFAATFGAREPRDPEARENGGPWSAALHNEER